MARPVFTGNAKSMEDLTSYHHQLVEWEAQVELAKSAKIEPVAQENALAGLFEQDRMGPVFTEGPTGRAGPKGADGYGPIAVTRITDLTYTVIDSDREIFVNTDTNAVTVTLQPGTQGRRMRLVNTGTSRRNLTVAPDGAEHLIGENSSFTLRDGETLVLVYDATDGWY